MSDFTPEQELLRKSGITASRMAAVVGLSPHMSAIALWRELVEGKEMEPNAFMARGNRLEKLILDWHGAETGLPLTYPGTIRSPEYERVLATPDAILDGRIVVEAKFVSLRSKQPWGEPGTDSIPPHILVQVQTQLGVMGMTEAHVPVLHEVSSPAFSGGRLSVYSVQADPSLFRTLATAATEFYETFVVTKTPPPRGYMKSKRDAQ